MQNATGEILLFLDIRPWMERNALQLLISNFEDPRVGCVTGELVLRDDGHDAGAQAVGGLYWRYEQWIRNCEAKVDSPLGVYGGFYAIRRKLASALPEGTILDDMLQPTEYHSPRLSIGIGPVRARVYDGSGPRSLRGEFQRKGPHADQVAASCYNLRHGCSHGKTGCASNSFPTSFCDYLCRSCWRYFAPQAAHCIGESFSSIRNDHSASQANRSTSSPLWEAHCVGSRSSPESSRLQRALSSC